MLGLAARMAAERKKGQFGPDKVRSGGFSELDPEAEAKK